MEENVNLNQSTETKFSILWFLYFIFFTIVFIILRLFSAIQTKEIIDFVDCFITFFAAVGLGLFVFNKSPESYGGHFWKIFALVFPVYDISKNILIDPILRHRGLLTFELFFSFLLIMPIYTALFIFSFRNSSSLTMVNLCNKKARLSLIYFLLFVIFLTTNIFINMHLDAISSVALKEERKLTTANYHYLNSLPVDEAHSLTVVEEHPKDFYVYAMKVVDLYHDNNKELVYKKDDNLYIVDKQWNILHQCFAGVEANGNEKILIEDINMDGVPEIITTGANKESALNEISLRVGAGAYSTIISYVNKSRVRIQFFSRYEPERIKTTIEELSKIVSIEKINENEIFLNKSDYEKISNTYYSLKIFDNRCNLINQYSISPANLGTSLLFSVENSSSLKVKF